MRRHVAFLLLLAVGCSKPPEAEQLRKSVVSWSASLELTARSWRAGQLPDRFVGTVTDGAIDELANQTRSSEAISPDLTAAAAHTVALAHELDDAVKRGDKGAVARDEQALAAIAKELRR